MNSGEWWAVVDASGKLMQSVLNEGPCLFGSQRAAAAFARTCDRDPCCDGIHQAVRVTLTVSAERSERK